MKTILKVFLLSNLLFVTVCSTNSQTIITANKQLTSNKDSNSNELNKKALTKLYAEIAKENQNAEIKNDEILVGESKIKVSVVPEQELKRDGKFIFAAKFDIKLSDNKDTLFTVGSVGIGNDQSDAYETVLDEWIGLFGTSFAQLFANSKTRISVGNFTVFPGLMGIRGEKPANNWIDGSAEMNKKIINSLLSIIRKSNKEVTSVNLLLTADESGIISGECRVNNEISQAIMDELKKLDWKTDSSSYMFKQYYLIKKN